MFIIQKYIYSEISKKDPLKQESGIWSHDGANIYSAFPLSAIESPVTCGPVLHAKYIFTLPTDTPNSCCSHINLQQMMMLVSLFDLQGLENLKAVPVRWCNTAIWWSGEKYKIS